MTMASQVGNQMGLASQVGSHAGSHASVSNARHGDGNHHGIPIGVNQIKVLYGNQQAGGSSSSSSVPTAVKKVLPKKALPAKRPAPVCRVFPKSGDQGEVFSLNQSQAVNRIENYVPKRSSPPAAPLRAFSFGLNSAGNGSPKGPLIDFPKGKTSPPVLKASGTQSYAAQAAAKSSGGGPPLKREREEESMEKTPKKKRAGDDDSVKGPKSPSGSPSRRTPTSKIRKDSKQGVSKDMKNSANLERGSSERRGSSVYDDSGEESSEESVESEGSLYNPGESLISHQKGKKLTKEIPKKKSSSKSKSPSRKSKSPSRKSKSPLRKSKDSKRKSPLRKSRDSPNRSPSRKRKDNKSKSPSRNDRSPPTKKQKSSKSPLIKAGKIPPSKSGKPDKKPDKKTEKPDKKSGKPDKKPIKGEKPKTDKPKVDKPFGSGLYPPSVLTGIPVSAVPVAVSSPGKIISDAKAKNSLLRDLDTDLETWWREAVITPSEAQYVAMYRKAIANFQSSSSEGEEEQGGEEQSGRVKDSDETPRDETPRDVLVKDSDETPIEEQTPRVEQTVPATGEVNTPTVGETNLLPKVTSSASKVTSIGKVTGIEDLFYSAGTNPESSSSHPASSVPASSRQLHNAEASSSAPVSSREPTRVASSAESNQDRPSDDGFSVKIKRGMPAEVLIREFELDDFRVETLKKRQAFGTTAPVSRFRFRKANASVDLFAEKIRQILPKGKIHAQPDYMHTIVVSYIHIDEDYRGLGLARIILKKCLEHVIRESDQVIEGIRWRIRPDSENRSLAAEHHKLAYLYSTVSAELDFRFRKTTESRTGNRVVELFMLKNPQLMEKYK